MKTVQSIFVALGLILTTSMTAATEPAPTTNVNEQASEEIANLLEAPTFEVKENMTASVSLMVNEDGELVVLCVKTDDEIVEGFVKSRLNYQKLATNLIKGHQYKLPLTITSKS